ncbi:acetate/propionate family kinase [Pseudoxanthomonas koreensis]|uniref:acetate/propionate family kinase n=1 Tax=Pseudoxanthomonas koreensis TaxID=266061 RepID=UPI001391A40B|nr:acetate/propionate family kinase [Pseudoxanthomonas koreensis]KAF1693704.1 acetate kinase [Pseudoxanthomonas koreensis]
MIDVILVLNAGSSSIKFSLFAADPGIPGLLMSGQIEGLYAAPRFRARDAAGAPVGEHRWPDGEQIGHAGAVAHLVGFLRGQRDRYRLCAAGHRVVHGGLAFSDPVRVDAGVVEALDALTRLAPLHQPHNLAPIRALLEQTPQLPQIACFDTAFHRGQPDLAQRFALPAKITDRGVRRYGFHGLSYEYIASAFPDLDPRAAAGRVVVAHLGNGASMCAMVDGRSVASTTGFTAVDGLPMGTRSGTLDPGVLLYLMDDMGMDARAIETLIYKESGLLGVSGISSDMRTLLASSEASAREAVDLFVYRIARELGSLAAAMGGLDALVFTGGIGEHAAVIRERACRDAAWLGLEFDAGANEAGGPRISTAGSRVSAWAIPTNEELMIARHTRRLVAAHGGAER